MSQENKSARFVVTLAMGNMVTVYDTKDNRVMTADEISTAINYPVLKDSIPVKYLLPLTENGNVLDRYILEQIVRDIGERGI